MLWLIFFALPTLIWHFGGCHPAPATRYGIERAHEVMQLRRGHLRSQAHGHGRSHRRQAPRPGEAPVIPPAAREQIDLWGISLPRLHPRYHHRGPGSRPLSAFHSRRARPLLPALPGRVERCFSGDGMSDPIGIMQSHIDGSVYIVGADGFPYAAEEYADLLREANDRSPEYLQRVADAIREWARPSDDAEKPPVRLSVCRPCDCMRNHELAHSPRSADDERKPS